MKRALIYQLEHSISDDHFLIEHKRDFSFPVHLHRYYEFILILAGELEVRIDNESKCLKENECAMIFPNQIHSLSCHEHSEHILYIFSPESVAYFNQYTQHSFPSTYFFSITDQAVKKMILALKENDNDFLIKGVLYSICGLYRQSTVFKSNQSKKSESFSLLKSILQYAESNYTSSCSLKDLAKHVGYGYAYISRLFSSNTGMSYISYINYLRINYACSLLSGTTLSILEISLQSGYDSLRSFNRNFLRIKGKSPSEYREYAINTPYSYT